MKYIDTHAHITSDFYNDDELNQLLIESLNNNIEMILIPGTSKSNSLEAIKMSKLHDNIHAGVGIHPADVSNKNFMFLDDLDYKDVKFIGETGLDLYRESNPSIEDQVESFEKHIQIAIENNLPVVVHIRDAYEEAYAVMKKYKDVVFILHSFSGDLNWANKFLELNSYISFSGIVTFKNAIEMKEVAKAIPLERLLVETDSPFLTPAPNRGKKNEPANVKHVADYIASIREEENVIETIYSNTKKVFNI